MFSLINGFKIPGSEYVNKSKNTFSNSALSSFFCFSLPKLYYISYLKYIVYRIYELIVIFIYIHLKDV